MIWGGEDSVGTATIIFWHSQLFPAEAVHVRTCSKLENMGKGGGVCFPASKNLWVKETRFLPALLHQHFYLGF